MTPINFLQPDPEIRQWTPAQSDLFSINNTFLIENDRPAWHLWLPLAIGCSTVAVSWGVIAFLNQSVGQQVASLEAAHVDYGLYSSRLASAQNKSEELKNQIKSFSALFSSSVPVYPFAHYLQQSIPDGVFLKSVSVDMNRLHLCAYSSTYEQMEGFMDLLKKMPAVEPETVRFSRMSSDPAVQATPDGCTSLSPNYPVSASINGRFFPQSIEDLESFYGRANDLGQFNKIKTYNVLVESLRGGS